MGSENVSEYVTLVSNDGYEFKLLRSAACIAGAIKRALNPECEWLFFVTRLILTMRQAGFQETTRNRMDFPMIKYVTHPRQDLFAIVVLLSSNPS